MKYYDVAHIGPTAGNVFFVGTPTGETIGYDMDARYTFAFPATSGAPNPAGSFVTMQAGALFDGMTVTATAPVAGSPIVVDVLRSGDAGATWSSLWASNPGGRPTIPVGATAGVIGSAPDAGIVIGDGDRLIFGVVSGTGTVSATMTWRMT
jgi:hypothetical protein